MTDRFHRTTWAALIALLMPLATAPVFAEDDDEGEHTGAMEYEIACQPCHGVLGKGDGPKAAGLSKPPSDLTQIAKRNNGVFPSQKITAMVDGRADVAAHGMRDMPVWGDRYRATTMAAGESKSFAESSARDQIIDLVDYLQSIQER